MWLQLQFGACASGRPIGWGGACYTGAMMRGQLSRLRRFKLAGIAAVITAVFAGVVWYAVAQTAESGGTYMLSEAVLVDDTQSASLKSVQRYRAEIEAAASNGQLVLQIDKPSQQQTDALEIVLNADRLQELVYDSEGGLYRVEVLQSYELPAGQAVGQLQSCDGQRCQRLDMYNFTLNTAVVAVVNLDTSSLLAMDTTDSQPDLPPELTAIATDIANNNPAVKTSLQKSGLAPAVMAGTKTALQKTVCEKSQHLCVAPTYVEAAKQRALWVIVDLTDLKVVGTAWTKWDDKPEPVTERQLASRAVAELCGTVKSAGRGDWSFDYTLTGSDGLEVRNLSFKGRPVLASAKNVDWHVSYSSRDGFGYSDAVGCPEFSTAAVIPSGLPELDDGPDGQVLFSMDFKGEKWPDPCNYYYRQQFQLNRDGSVRVAVANIGRGCGDDGTYRPVTRIALPAQASSFVRPDNNRQQLARESWWQPAGCEAGQSCPTLAYTTGRQIYEVIPGNGQFTDNGRNDNPYLYLTASQPQRLEGSQDLLTIGPCCNVDHQQGPEKFVNDEPLPGQGGVLWYVAQIENSGEAGQEYCWATGRNNAGRYEVDQYPCYSGPLFKPRQQ